LSINRKKQIQQYLEEIFQPTELLLKDQSHLHVDHEGAKDGKSHFDVKITSYAFAGKSRIQRHRLIYDALESMFESDIHALQIKAYTPAERQ
jgi:BolA protein